MKFFAKHNAKIDPRSRKFVEVVTTLLEKHGITDEKKRGQCSFYLFQSTIKYYRKMQGIFEKGAEAVDEATAQKQAEDMAGILSKYGITTPDEQEEIIMEYFSTLTDMGMWVAGEREP